MRRFWSVWISALRIAQHPMDSEARGSMRERVLPRTLLHARVLCGRGNASMA
jgi:hypothetical protein